MANSREEVPADAPNAPRRALTVKRLTTADHGAATRLFALMAEVFGEEPRILRDAYVATLLGRQDFWAIAAYADEVLVGGLTAHALPMTRAESAELFVYDIAVSPEFQRIGVGRSLVATLRRLAADAGISALFVPADSDDQQALDFYRAIGGDPAPVTMFTFIDPA